MFQKLFAIEHNNKIFLLFRAEDYHIAFLEWKRNGVVDYPSLDDYLELNEMFNNHDFSIKAAKKTIFREKINWKGLALALVMYGSAIYGYSKLIPVIENSSFYVRMEENDNITERTAFFEEFEERVSREDVVDAINNNPNIPDNYKIFAIEVMDENLKLDPNVDLRIYYENMRRLKVNIVTEAEADKKGMNYAAGWYNCRDCSITIKDSYKDLTSVVRHEFNHAFHGIYMEVDGKLYTIYETRGSSLEEAMTEKVVETEQSFAYTNERKLLNFFIDSLGDSAYEIYNSKGVSGLTQAMKEKYPDVDINYIVSYADAWRLANLYGKKTDHYNFGELAGEVFNIAMESITQENPYRALSNFFTFSQENINAVEAMDYLEKYNIEVDKKGFSKEKSNDMVNQIINNFDVNIRNLEEAERFYETLYNLMIQNIKEENVYFDLKDFMSVMFKSDCDTDDLVEMYQKRYDEEIIRRGLLTKGQVDTVRDIECMIKVGEKIYFAFDYPGCTENTRTVYSFIMLPMGRDCHVTVLNSSGERETITITEPFEMRRLFSIGDQGALLNQLVNNRGTSLADLKNEETARQLAEYMEAFDDRKFNCLSTGEQLFDKITPDMFVVVGLDENKELGFQLKKGEEVLYSTCDRFTTPTAKIPYSIYPFMNYMKEGHDIDFAVDELLSRKFFEDQKEVILHYFAPNIKITRNPEYDVITNPDVIQNYYQFEEPIILDIEGKEYASSDVYVFTEYEKGPDEIFEELYLHLPNEEDMYLGNRSERNVPFYDIEFFDELIEIMGIKVPEDRVFHFTKEEFKELLIQFIEKTQHEDIKK